MLNRPFLHSVESMAISLFCVVWLLVSCGHSGRTSTGVKGTLQSITVSPSNATIAVGQTQQYTAEAHYSDGSSRKLPPSYLRTSDVTLANFNFEGLVTALKSGNVMVTATLPSSGPMTGSAPLTIVAPNSSKPTTLGVMVPVVKVSSQGEIPADFSVADAMRSLYGNFDSPTQASISSLPAGAEENSFFERAKEIEVHPFFIAGVKDSGVNRVFLGTYAGPLGEGFACHGCAPLIGMAAFARTSASWVVESSTKSALFSGQWGEPPGAHILRIGPEHIGVKLEGQGAFSTYVSILVPWSGEIREAFGTIIAEGNGAVCGDEEGMQPCVGTQKSIAFVKGSNSDYDDIVLTLSGTTLSEKPPYKVVQASGIERRTFSDGKYVLAVSTPD
jgi:Bacterial Ig-like domain (group 2)